MRSPVKIALRLSFPINISTLPLLAPLTDNSNPSFCSNSTILVDGPEILDAHMVLVSKASR
ncbi:hypothetical protein CEXT_177511, partial [Caerostris extrusa]